MGIKKAIGSVKFFFISPFVDWNNKKMLMDIDKWSEIYHIEGNNKKRLCNLLATFPEFRNLFIFRATGNRPLAIMTKLFYKPMDTLYICTNEIGGGLFIQHGFATMISATSIGENCWINQQVTIGYNGHGRPPIIGDNVMICCGAKVLGSINVDNNVVIGANAVVIRDVEEGAVMGGVPAHKLK